jgi:hypothetical protein
MDCLEANPIRPVCCLRGWLILFELNPLFFSSREFTRLNIGFVSGRVGEGVAGTGVWVVGVLLQ